MQVAADHTLIPGVKMIQGAVEGLKNYYWYPGKGLVTIMVQHFSAAIGEHMRAPLRQQPWFEPKKNEYSGETPPNPCRRASLPVSRWSGARQRTGSPLSQAWHSMRCWCLLCLHCCLFSGRPSMTITYPSICPRVSHWGHFYCTWQVEVVITHGVQSVRVDELVKTICKSFAR